MAVGTLAGNGKGVMQLDSAFLLLTMITIFMIVREIKK